MLNEHNPLRSYSKAESDLDIAADPLVFLGCGHVIHMTTMDQYMALDDVYSKDGQEHWAAPCLLGVCICYIFDQHPDSLIVFQTHQLQSSPVCLADSC